MEDDILKKNTKCLCKYNYHQKCEDKYIVENQIQCPLCRKKIPILQEDHIIIVLNQSIAEAQQNTEQVFQVNSERPCRKIISCILSFVCCLGGIVFCIFFNASIFIF